VPQVVPSRVFDVGDFECRMEPILHVFDGLGLATALGSRNSNDAVKKVHVAPPKGEEAASSQVC
jgi:hypothetical protein